MKTRLPFWAKLPKPPKETEKLATFQRSTSKTKPGALHTTKTVAPVESFSLTIAPEPGMTVLEEMLLLGALRKFVYTNPNLRVRYVTEYPSVYPLLKNAWFLKDGLLLQPDTLTAYMGSVSNIPLVIGVPDREGARWAEEDLYRQAHTRTVEGLKRQQAEIDESGMRDIRIPIPEYHFAPSWNKGSALLWRLGEELGLPINLPPNGVTAPWGVLSAGIEREAVAPLRSQKIHSAPFVLYDPVLDPDEVRLLASLRRCFPNERLVSLDDVCPGDDALHLLAVMRCPNLTWFIGTGSLATHAAWLGGVPRIIELYEGEDAIWDGCRSHHSFIVAREALGDHSFSDVLPDAVFYCDSRV